MRSDNISGSDKYRVQIDRLNYLIYAQEMILRLKKDNMVSAASFQGKWIYYEYRIKDMLDFLKTEGFIVLFDSENHRPLFVRVSKGHDLRMNRG